MQEERKTSDLTSAPASLPNILTHSIEDSQPAVKKDLQVKY
jgi:hypothetical protein